MDVADEGGFAAAPGVGEIGKAHGDASDAGPASVENAVESDRQRGSEQNLNEQVEVGMRASQESDCVDSPGRDCCKEQEAEQTEPCGGGTVKKAQDRACIAEGEERGDEKTYGQNAQ